MTVKKQAGDRGLVRVTFIRAWRHGGKDYKPDDPAEVTPAAKAKLLKREAIKS